MLDRFPPEIIEQILGHLPTASSIANVALTNRKLYSIVSADDYGVFRYFVQRAFPSIVTPPLWKHMACALTSRSRAWDRRAFIARECYPPEDSNNSQHPVRRQRFGYIPVIDSYDQWLGNDSFDRKQVLAFGAGGRLRLRIEEKDRTEWKSLRLPDDHLQQNDIVDVRLLRPHQHHNLHGETIMLRKANREIVKVVSGVGKDNVIETARFIADGVHIDCLDVSMNADPLMAVCSTRSLQVFAVNTDEDVVRPCSNSSFAQNFIVKCRKRCIKFLDDSTVAMGVQFLEGRDRAPILTYKIHPSGISTSNLQPSLTLDLDHAMGGRHCANVIANLESTNSLAGRPGQVFLSGWTDGIVRLHDLRTPSQTVAKYTDHVDDGQILSLSVVGHERFFAGSHQNACLKVFDLRQGSKTYSYSNAVPRACADNIRDKPVAKTTSADQRDINIFLALTVQRNHLWAPLPRQQNPSNLPRYRGSIYSLSTPSPSSTTLFAGIENHVIQLDFVSTDDIVHTRSNSYDTFAGLSKLSTPASRTVLSLSCYERPRETRVATDTVLLRKQVEWQEAVRGVDDSQYGPSEDGWDDRWRMTRSWKTQSQSRRWRGGQTT